MESRLFKRKIYSQLLNWKQESDGKTALLVEGARRVGKSTIVETFAKNEYESYLLIDFNKASKAIKDLFNDLMDLDYLFLYLQTAYHVTLKTRESLSSIYQGLCQRYGNHHDTGIPGAVFVKGRLNR